LTFALDKGGATAGSVRAVPKQTHKASDFYLRVQICWL